MQLRKDYILDRWVIIAPNRGKRPSQFKKESADRHVDKCFFCPGNEDLTPQEIGRVVKDDDHDQWMIRWFDNKFAAVTPDGSSDIETHNSYYTFADAVGKHEVIVETPDHEQMLWDLPPEHIRKLLEVYTHRIEELEKIDGIKYVCIFKNSGPDAGASLPHAHTQLIAYDKVPSIVQEKVNANKDLCHYCNIIDAERGSERHCFENDHFVAFCPYASRFNFEVWVFAKQHVTRLEDMDLGSLADMMHKILSKLKELNASYNYVLQYSPDGDDLHLHIEVLPRLAKWAGFEFCSETIINKVAPEDAAAFYRGDDEPLGDPSMGN